MVHICYYADTKAPFKHTNRQRRSKSELYNLKRLAAWHHDMKQHLAVLVANLYLHIQAYKWTSMTSLPPKSIAS